jgi:N-ethylmaleimide reductase
MTNALSDTPLLRPYVGPALRLPNRVAMSPMTRGRADDVTGVPHPATPVYYAQRASAGLIVSEGIWPTAAGKNGPGQPGLETAAQVEGWRRVTTAVHAAGGRIFAQLWHGGRVSHPLTLPDGRPPLAPSAVRMAGSIFNREGWTETVTPSAMTLAEIEATIEAFAAAARNAIEAGFDGVELHGANGYLIQEFIADNTNQRGDRYGGSLNGRLRFPLDVVDAVVAAVGAGRVGLRLSPGNAENDIVEDDPATTYRALVDALETRGLAYLHLLHAGDYPTFEDLRPRWSGTLLGNVNAGAEPMGREVGERLLDDRLIDVAVFGRLFLANPDLPLRFAAGAPLAEADGSSYYGAMDEGYVDYPAADLDALCGPLVDDADRSEACCA